MPNIASILKELRKSHAPLTQKEISNLLEINERTYRRYELNECEPSAANIIKISDFYNISADYLLGRSDNPTRT